MRALSSKNRDRFTMERRASATQLPELDTEQHIAPVTQPSDRLGPLASNAASTAIWGATSWFPGATTHPTTGALSTGHTGATDTPTFGPGSSTFGAGGTFGAGSSTFGATGTFGAGASGTFGAGADTFGAGAAFGVGAQQQTCVPKVRARNGAPPVLGALREWEGSNEQDVGVACVGEASTTSPVGSHASDRWLALLHAGIHYSS